MAGFDPLAEEFEPSGAVVLWNGHRDDPPARAAYPGLPPDAVPAHLNGLPGINENDFRGNPINGNLYQIVKLKEETPRSTRVYVVHDISRQEELALKTISDYDRQSKMIWGQKKQKCRIRQEVWIHNRVNHHRNICTLHAVFQYTPVGHLLMELCKTDLQALIEQSCRQPVNLNIKKLFLDTIDGVMHCHQLNVAHRHLNPRNVGIIFDAKYNEDKAVLLDFGEAVSGLISKHCLDLDVDCYTAPELHQRREGETPTYNWAAADIWSLGVILFYMCTASKPFDDSMTLLGPYRQGQPLQSRFPQISDKLEAIFREIFMHNPNNRVPLGKLKLTILKCKNFFSVSYRGSQLTGTLGNRNQDLLRNQRVDQRDDVHDDFYGGLSDTPLALPAPPSRPQLTWPFQPDERDQPVQRPKAPGSALPAPAGVIAAQTLPEQTTDLLPNILPKPVADRIAAAHESADRFFENRRNWTRTYSNMVDYPMSALLPWPPHGNGNPRPPITPMLMPPQPSWPDSIPPPMPAYGSSGQIVPFQDIPAQNMPAIPAQGMPAQNIPTPNPMNMPPWQPEQPRVFRPPRQRRPEQDVPVPNSNAMVRNASNPIMPSQSMLLGNGNSRNPRPQSTPAQNVPVPIGPAQNTVGAHLPLNTFLNGSSRVYPGGERAGPPGLLDPLSRPSRPPPPP
ncbi:hypothetical protein ONS95_008505 [Cadophora gregata]|uniref:uncharacterized protein n=1 Tax=Cadophora gregata TaxID=51156 RepID=UPI0026DDB22E|nr:uncharacterized protein ONS95_008505 [Cadophora gregata]KAK0100167.1 hypothetical protein ONS95_008505 [Cadophora gregata]